MRILYDNPFSPFARKVRMVLHHKQLSFESVDALAVHELDRLREVNPRGEVPVLVDDATTVIDSADIVDYLDHRHPEPPVLPADPVARADARAWQRLGDHVLDAIVHDVSIWAWPTLSRDDAPPAGLLEAGARDLRAAVRRMDEALAERDFLAGELSIADFALFPHVTALRPLGIELDRTADARVLAWMKRMRALPAVARDLEQVKAAMSELLAGRSPYEKEKIVWRGDRLEWLFANGFHDWWADELAAGRAVVPRHSTRRSERRE